MSTALNPGDVIQSTFVLKNRDNVDASSARKATSYH